MSRPDRAPLAHPGRIFINGRWVESTGSDSYDVIDAATEATIATVPRASLQDVDRAVAAARAAFDQGEWPRLPVAERVRHLRALSAAIRRRAADFGATWSMETGVLHSFASARLGEIMAGLFDQYAMLGDRFAFEEPRRAAGGQAATLVREPVGVVGAIVPWNGPGALMTYKCAPALLAGCTVVLKAAPEAPCLAYLFAEVCDEVGLPPGVVNVLTTDRIGSKALVSDPRIDKITFTGSTEVGRDIAATLAQRIARVTLELGGKSPALVLDDYPVDEAAAALTGGMCMLSGQVCHSLTRILVSRARHDQMVEALCARFTAIQIGDPFAASSEMGPLASARQRENVERYIAVGQAEGARLACGGARPEGATNGFYIQPTVFANVDNSMTIAREEIFGPVVCVIPYDDEDHAIEIANDTIYGLNASIFTHDDTRFAALAHQIRAGTVGQNGSRTDVSIAFGGFKQSGIGREGGIDGLMPYLEAKVIVTDRPTVERPE